MQLGKLSVLILSILGFFLSPYIFGVSLEIKYFDHKGESELIMFLKKKNGKYIPVSHSRFSECQIQLLETKKKYRGQGYAKRVLEETIKKMDHCKSIFISACPRNEEIRLDKLIHLYSHFGFKCLTEIDEPNECDMALMSLNKDHL